jgi:hypothetical protein
LIGPHRLDQFRDQLVLGHSVILIFKILMFREKLYVIWDRRSGRSG